MLSSLRQTVRIEKGSVQRAGQSASKAHSTSIIPLNFCTVSAPDAGGWPRKARPTGPAAGP